MHFYAGKRQGLLSGNERPIADCPLHHLVTPRKNRRKGLVNPIYNRWCRTVIAVELQALKANIADSMRGRLDKQINPRTDRRGGRRRLRRPGGRCEAQKNQP